MGFAGEWRECGGDNGEDFGGEGFREGECFFFFLFFFEIVGEREIEERDEKDGLRINASSSLSCPLSHSSKSGGRGRIGEKGKERRKWYLWSVSYERRKDRVASQRHPLNLSIYKLN